MPNALKEKREKKPQSENKIPDYDYLFATTEKKGRGKKNPFFRKLIKLHFFPLLFSTFVYLLQCAPIYAIPICTANIINILTDVIGGGGMTQAALHKLGVNGVVMGVLILQNVPATMWRWRILSKILRRASAGIKSSVVRKLQSLSITYHKDMQTGRIQSKFLKDTDAVDSLFHLLLFSLIPNVIGVIVAVVISVRGSLWVTLFFLLIVPANVTLTICFRKRIRQRHRDYRKNTENMSVKVTTMLEMIPVTKAHGLEEKEIQNVEQSIVELANSGKEMDKTMAAFGSGSYVVNHLLSACCLFFCAILAFYKIIAVGDIVLYQSMFTTISTSITALINVMPTLSSGFDALESVSEIMGDANVEKSLGKPVLSSVEGNIQFDHLSYKYPNTEELVVKDFCLDVKAGECIAVVGSSGSGKSTLMNLIIGLLLPTEGDLRIDGQSITQLNLSEYRRHISVVPQSSILFSGSIRENITYGLDTYTEEQLQRVLEMANVNQFVQELPSGLDTNVGEHGDKLSGGQRQRVTIARALIRDPRILILDEATSALDNVSEYHVQQAISRSVQGRTTFIVAHRLSTIRNADRIIVLEEGKAVEIGTYDQLMEKRGKFYRLKQLNELNLKEAESGLQ